MGHDVRYVHAIFVGSEDNMAASRLLAIAIVFFVQVRCGDPPPPIGICALRRTAFCFFLFRFLFLVVPFPTCFAVTLYCLEELV